MQSKYKAGEVLMTRMGKIFTVTKVVKEPYHGSESPIETVYHLKGHPYNRLPARYLEEATHITWATEAAQIIYATDV